MILYSNTWEIENSVCKYNITYSSYDQLYREEQFIKYRFVFEEKGLKPGGIVLDIGCGTGLLLEYLFSNKMDYFNKYFCLDPSIGMLSRVIEEKRFDNRVVIINSYGEYIPLRNRSVDTVYLFTVWDNVIDREALLEEVFRVLSPGGYVLISTLERTDSLKPVNYCNCFKLIGCRMDCFYIYCGD